MVSRFDIVEREKIVNLSQLTLWDEKEGKTGRDYLFDKRKLNVETIKNFKLGFIPSVNHFLANRIIFPIFDPSEQLMAISSRSIVDEPSLLPIYWHERFNKSFYLYGMNASKQEIRNNNLAVVTEGNFDVLKCHNEGLKNVVALMGSSISEIQLAVLLRYCENVIFVFDNDENKSGQKGSLKAETKIKKYSSYLNSENEYDGMNKLNLLNTQFVMLPDKGSDPDSYVRQHGIEELKKVLRLEKKNVQI